MMRKVPWLDYAGNEIHEGDRIQHPDGNCGTVTFFEFEESPEDQWRVVYDDGNRQPGWTASISRLCLQIGDKGQAVVMPS